ncbi:hypothetical protein [Caulifigura coniformis]|nr:hypothetical protein [Caulifigura coniformis]
MANELLRRMGLGPNDMRITFRENPQKMSSILKFEIDIDVVGEKRQTCNRLLSYFGIGPHDEKEIHAVEPALVSKLQQMLEKIPDRTKGRER